MTTKSFCRPRSIAGRLVVFLLVLAVLPVPANAFARIARNTSTTQKLTTFHALSRLLAKTALSDSSPESLCSVVWNSGPKTPDRSIDCPATARSASAQDQTSGETVPEGSAAPISLRAKEIVETPTGLIATAALPGAPSGAHVVVHSNGAVSSVTAEGDMVWNRPSLSFTDQTGRRPKFPPLPPRVLMGIDPVDPFVEAGEHPFAVGDLTGDGLADVAVAHFFFGAVGISGDANAMVSVLDGATGEFVWSHLYPGYVTNVLIANGLLVVANETGDPRRSNGPLMGRDGSASELDAWRFSPSAEGTDVSHAWSHSTGAGWARWLSLEPVGEAEFAAAWSATPVGSSEDVRGHVLIAPVATGVATWSVDTPGYPRFLRYDSSGGQVVVAEQDDPLASDQMGYSLIGRSVADGSTVSSLVQENAIALNLQVGNINDAPGTEWVVADLAVTPGAGACPTVEVCFSTGSLIAAGRVTSFDPESGVAEWSQSRGPGSDTRSPLNTPQPYGLLLDPAGGRVIVASFMPGASDTELQVLDGATGSQVWAERAPNLLFPVFLSPYELDGRTSVMGASSRLNVYGGGGGTLSYTATATATQAVHTTTPYQVVSAFDLETGERNLRTPLLGEVYAAVGSHVNGDATSDLIVGGESGALFALDGARLNDDNLPILWRTSVSGPVRQIELADLDGNGQDELVVAATSGVDVLDARAGTLRYTIPYPNDFVWTLTVGDLNGDQAPDIVVPTTSLDAYRGSDGSPLWAHEPQSPTTPAFSNAVIADNSVVTQYMRSSPSNEFELGYVAPGNQTGLALDASNGTVLWSHPQVGPNVSPIVWRGVVAGADVPGVEGTAAAFTWDRFTTNSTPGVDVYDLATGTLAYSGVADPGRANFGTELVPGKGIEAFNFRGSILVDPAGSHPNLNNASPTDLVRASFGSLGVRYVMANWSSRISVLATDAFGAGQGVEAAAWDQRMSIGRLHVHDLDEDGSDEIIATAFDWDGYSTTQLFEGRFSFTTDIVAHGFAVLEAVAANSPTPTPTETASPSPSPSISESPLPEDSEVSFTEHSAGSGQYSDEVTFEARLAGADDKPINGAKLTFRLVGEGSTRSFETSTDEDGVARVTPRLKENPGAHQLTVRYEGDEERAPSADTMAFVVEKEDSALELSVHGEDDDKALEARLSDLDTSSEAITDRTIDFYSDGELIGSSQTGADGVASLPVPPRHRGNNRTYKAVFEGDDFYLASLAERAGKGGNAGGTGGRGAVASYSKRLLLM